MPAVAKRFLITCALLLVSWLIFVYPWQHLFLWSTNLQALSLPQIIVIWFLPIILFFIWMKLRSPISAVFGQISVNWLGISMMFMWATGLTEALHLTGIMNLENAAPITFFVGIILCAYGIYKATHIQVTNQIIKSKKLSQAYKIAHLSDIHLGSRSQNFVRKIINKTNLLNPDLVFITGDLIDMRKVKPELLQVLEEFSAPVFFIKGNHDRYISSNDHFTVVDKTGVITLDNRYHDHHDLQIIGIADSADPNQLDTVLPTIRINHDRFTVLLYHKPEKFDFVAENKIDLMLSGHTHAGQMFPFNFIVKKQFPHLKGLFKLDSSHLYV